MDRSKSLLLLCLYIAGVLYYIIFAGITSALIPGTVLLGCFLYLIVSLFTKDQEPKLYYVETPLAKHVIQHCKRLTEPFRPPYWARNAHIQTVITILFPIRDFEFKREVLNLSDGGLLALDYGITGISSIKPNAPILVVIPGINGASDSVAYVCKEAVRRGYRPVVYNKRGFGGSPLTTPKMLGCGDPADLREAIIFLEKAYRPSEFVSVSYSAGTVLLRSYLGEYGSSSEISVGVCNSPGYKHKMLFQKLMQPYDFVMLKGYKEMLQKHRETLSEVIDVQAAFNTKRVMDFEVMVQGRLSNCNDVDEYCRSNEPDRCLQNSVMPFLCINSADDPVCLEELIDYEFYQQQPNAMLAVVAEGGHCGFVERGSWNRWADDLALDYIDAVLLYRKGQVL